MSINLKEGSQITQSDVANHIGVNKDYNIFELQNAIGRLNHTKINKIVNYLLANTNENPIQAMLPNLFAYFVKVIITAQLKDKTNENTIAATIPDEVKSNIPINSPIRPKSCAFSSAP